MREQSSEVSEQEDLEPRCVGASDAIVDALVSSGCRRAFGLLGGAGLPFFAALVRGGLEPVHFRHEAGAVFAAIEHDIAGGGPVLIFTTTGPGLTNTLTGIAAARWEGAHVVLVSASTGPDRRGRWAFQETSDRTYPHHGLFTDGGWFDYATAIQSPEEIPGVIARLRQGLSRPEGFVAHISLPLSIQDATLVRRPSPPSPAFTMPTAPAALVDACAERIMNGRTCLWVGSGARTAWAEVRRLADAVTARVMCSPRGKGIFPESDPRFLGVTGFGGHERLFEALAAFRPTTTVVLGSRLGEFTSFWDERLVDSDCLIHVDVDARVFNAAYPEVPTLAVQAEIRGFLQTLLGRLPRPGIRTITKRHPRVASTSAPRVAASGVRPSALMASLQRVVVERSDLPIISEPGNAFVWTTHALSFDLPGRYRTSMGFGSMGHAAAGVIGLAMARSGPALAVVGDGALLMNNEINTAVSLGVPAIWVVLNDGRYGLVADGMQGLGYTPLGLDFSQVDFSVLARSLGAEGEVVHHEADLDHVLQEAVSAGCPFVVDVRVDPSELAPFGARNRSLADQRGGP